MTFRSTVNQSIKHGLYIVGALPSTSFLNLQKSCWIVITVISLFYQTMYVITHFLSDQLPQLFDCFTLVFTYLLLLVKLTVASLNSSVLYGIVTSMEEDCVKYTVADAKNFIPKAADLSQTVTRAVILTYVGSATFYSVSILAAPQVNDTVPRQLLLNMDLPFDTIETPNYELVVAIQFINIVMTGYGYGVFSAFLLVTVVHMGCQIDILCHTMTSIAFSKDKKKFRKITQRHQELIVFSEQIEQMFTYISFAQLISNTICLCCLGYLIIISVTEGNQFVQLIRFSYYYIAICVEIFTYCFAGEYLIVKNDMIIEAAYRMTWYRMQPSMSRQVLFLLLRSQKGMQLTVGKFSKLRLETFTWVSCQLQKSRAKMTLRSTVNQSIKYGLFIVGALPSTSFLNLQKSFWIIFTAVTLFYQFMYGITHFLSDQLPEVFDCFSLVFTYFLLFVKLIVVSLNSGVLYGIVTSMEDDCVKYTVADTKNFIPKAAELSQIVTKSVIITYVGFSAFYAVTTLAAPQVNDTLPRRLVLNMDLPFNTIDSPNYELVVLAQTISLLMTGYAYSVFSSLLLVAVLHMGCQIDILCHVMTSIASSKDEKTFRSVAERHQELIAFSEEIEQMFTYISFAQLISNTMCLCCLGYLVVISVKEGSEAAQLIKFCLYYVGTCIEIFTYCFAGEYLNVKNDMIVDAAYQMTWYHMRPSMSRQVLFLLLRSQKGMQLTIGKFSKLRLETFSWIMKSSASYMSVFLAIEMGSRSTISQSMKYGLCAVGSWPGTHFSSLLKFCWLLFTTSSVLLQIIYLFTHIRSDGLAQLFDCCGFISTYSLLCVKITVLWLNQGALSDILTSMEEDCVKYSVIDTNNLIPKAADLSRIATKTVIVIYVGCSTFFSFATIASPQSDFVNGTISRRRLILNMNLPFNTNISPTYEIVMILQFTSLIMSTYVYSICSGLLLMVMVHMGCQVDILCEEISKIATSKDHKKFQFVARRHQELIVFSERIEEVFTFIAVAQLLTNTIVTCCVGYIVIYTLQEGNDLPQLLKYVCSYIAICSEIFTYCFAGEYLNIKSDLIVDTAYQISWYNLEPSMSRHVILLLLRSQKGLRLTFGKISTLSLRTFSGIMKSSASYMSVFLAKS
ncbi:uncharacterized protein LOC144476576 [Augochlora pura]